MFIKPLINILMVGIIAFPSVSEADPASNAACTAATHGGSSAEQIPLIAISTLYNVFPIRLAGIELNPTGNEDSSSDTSASPICTCVDPFPRVGISLSLWEPLLIAEPTAIPFCSPTIGTEIPVNIGFGAESFGQNETESAKFTHTYQAHIIKYPIFALLGLFLDFVCLQADQSVDYLYLTELDPLWQNDIWAAILGPEAFLVANPIAEMACIADSITSNVGFPLDPLWWCLGSWNGAFPMTQTNKGTTAAEAQAAITARMLMKLHRQMMLYGSVGNQGLCGLYPMPIMRKSQYGIFPIYPIPFENRIPIGRSGIVLWGSGQENPLNQHVGAWMIYRKRSCCAF